MAVDLAVAHAGGPGGAAAAPTSEKLADGVFRINGAYNALAIEFADHIVLFEPGPQNEARAQAIIAETKKVIPNKPIRYGVISHHHFDHTSGLPAVVAEGITIVTPEVNKAFLMNALSAPRTLAPDSLSKSGKKPVIEGFTGDKRVFQDATRTFEVHVIKGLPHADGLVVGYLPKEKILVYADMFNLPPADAPVPDPPVTGTIVFADNIDRLKLDVERIMSVHSLNPDRLTSVADIKASLGGSSHEEHEGSLRRSRRVNWAFPCLRASASHAVAQPPQHIQILLVVGIDDERPARSAFPAFSVSIRMARSANRGSASSRRNGSRPTNPLPICSWRSTRLPHGFFESLP